MKCIGIIKVELEDGFCWVFWLLVRLVVVWVVFSVCNVIFIIIGCSMNLWEFVLVDVGSCICVWVMLVCVMVSFMMF